MSTTPSPSQLRPAPSADGLDRLRRLLIDELEQQAAALHDAEATASELTGDVGSELEREMAEGTALRSEAAMAEIRAALDRLDAGTYGRCESCDDPIAPERLEAIPHARTCVTCQVA